MLLMTLKRDLKHTKLTLMPLRYDTNQAAIAFSTCARPLHPNSFTQPKHYSPQPNAPRPTFNCNNCGKPGHLALKCYTTGGGLAGQAPWMNKQSSIPSPSPIYPQSITQNRNTSQANQNSMITYPLA